jgi:hypothetical protein
MKIPLLTASIILAVLLAAVTARAKGGGFPHDSLVEEGTGHSHSPQPVPGPVNCIVKVVKVNFSAYGTVRTVEMASICGERDTIEHLRRKRLEVGDEVLAGDSISTGPDGLVTVQLNDGRQITLGESSSIKMDGKYCLSTDSWVELRLHYGKVAISSRDGSQPTMTNVSTSQMSIHTKGTIFTVEPAAAGVELVRVFKGAVEVHPNTDTIQAAIATMGTEMMKLNEDMEKKRIKRDEYMRRLMVLSAAIQKESEALTKVITLTAGYECRVDGKGKATSPARFASEKKWFD